MKKKAKILFAVILVAFLLVLSSCGKQKPTSVDVSIKKEQPVVQADTAPKANETETAGEEPQMTPGSVKISPSDSGGPLLFNYIVDEQDASIIKSVKFQIRNFGKEKIVPYMTLMVENDDNDHQKQFTYGELQPGYKLLEEEEVNIQIIHPRNPVVITANLFDKNTKKWIGKVDYTYLAQPLDS